MRKREGGKKTTGWPSAAKALGQHGEAVVRRVKEWLGLGRGAAPGQAGAWPEPLLFAEPAAPPPFPTDLLPAPLADWVRRQAEATQTPPDLAGMLALAACGAGLARKLAVRVRPGWSEPLNLYAVVALPPGDRKSAVFSAALAPVVDHEASEAARLGPVIAEAAS